MGDLDGCPYKWCLFFFCILFVYCFIKLNIQLLQKRNLQHKKKGNTIILRTKTITIYEFTEHTI